MPWIFVWGFFMSIVNFATQMNGEFLKTGKKLEEAMQVECPTD